VEYSIFFDLYYFFNIDISTTKICLDISILAKSIMDFGGVQLFMRSYTEVYKFYIFKGIFFCGVYF
jgi:hypothetical protein